jgi:hypothetical protein
MTIPQIISLVGVCIVGLMYLWPLIRLPSTQPGMLKHISNVLAIREAYPDAKVLAASNALMEALLEIK